MWLRDGKPQPWLWKRKHLRHEQARSLERKTISEALSTEYMANAVSTIAITLTQLLTTEES